MAKDKKEAPANQPKKKKKAVGLFIAIIFAMLAVVMLPMTLVIVVGLIPAAAAYFADTSPNRDLGPTVLVMNIAGIMPALLKLWHHGATVGNAVEILMQPSVLLLILMPAGFGWVLFYSVPHLFSGLMRRKAENRIRSLERYQQELIEQWGNNVSLLAAPMKADPAKAEATPPGSVSA